jgi:hypothetical protein
MSTWSLTAAALIASSLNTANTVHSYSSTNAPLQLIQDSPFYNEKGFFKLTKQEETEGIQFCLKAGLGEQAFCEVWSVEIPNYLTREEYHTYRSLILEKKDPTGLLKQKVDALLEDDRGITSGAR